MKISVAFLRKCFSALVIFCLVTLPCGFLNAAQDANCLKHMDRHGAFLISDPQGRILYKQNETAGYIPASSIKLVTALAAIHYLGLSHRFRTEFYMDRDRNLKIKGYGDPLLTTEVWQEIARELSKNVHEFNHLILDDSYFSPDIRIPGREDSTNPYDAPPGSLCANFNTIFFDHDPEGNIISSEPQTPITPLAGEKIQSLGLKKGRHTFSHDRRDVTRYAGELFLHLVKKEGIIAGGDISFGPVLPEDKLVYTYHSRFSLGEVIRKMMEFSNNFIANQICIGLGARLYEPPGSIEKGVRVINDYVKNELGLANVHIAEGSGMSRENLISASDMNLVLNRFQPYRHLLKRKDNLLFKTGRLEGIRTRVGYIESNANSQYSFVVFLNNGRSNIDSFVRCIKKTCSHQDTKEASLSIKHPYPAMQDESKNK